MTTWEDQEYLLEHGEMDAIFDNLLSLFSYYNFICDDRGNPMAVVPRQKIEDKKIEIMDKLNELLHYGI